MLEELYKVHFFHVLSRLNRPFLTILNASLPTLFGLSGDLKETTQVKVIIKDIDKHFAE